MFPVLRRSVVPAPFFTSPFGRFDSLFDRVFGEDGGKPGQPWPALPLAMWEDDDHLYVEVELPGVTESDVEVTVHNGSLIIRGERKPPENRGYLYNGLSFGRFERVLTLPEAVDTSDVEATLESGMLRMTLRKSPEARPKKITLRTGSSQ